MLFPDALYVVNLATGVLFNSACCCYNMMQIDKEHRFEYLGSPDDASNLCGYQDTESKHQLQVRKYNESVAKRMKELQKRNQVLKRDELVKAYNDDYKRNRNLNRDEMNRSYRDSLQQEQGQQQSSETPHTRIPTKRTRTITPRTNNCCSRERSPVETDHVDNTDSIEVLAEGFSVHDVFASNTDDCYTRPRAPFKTKITIVDSTGNDPRRRDSDAPKARSELDHATMTTIFQSPPTVVRKKETIDKLRVRRNAYRSLRKKSTNRSETLSLLDNSDDDSLVASEDSMEEITIE